jgi:hypothetical protein
MRIQRLSYQLSNIFRVLLLTLLFTFCSDKKPTSLNSDQFVDLMNTTAKGWSTQDVEMSLSCFAEDAIYMEPPSSQLYKGHVELRRFFKALNKSHSMTFHNLWFDEQAQSGVGEFTFSYGSDTASVGVVVVELSEGKISFWREYFTEGPADFKEFLKVEDKNWKWTIDNY